MLPYIAYMDPMGTTKQLNSLNDIYIYIVVISPILLFLVAFGNTPLDIEFTVGDQVPTPMYFSPPAGLSSPAGSDVSHEQSREWKTLCGLFPESGMASTPMPDSLAQFCCGGKLSSELDGIVMRAAAMATCLERIALTDG